MNLNLKMVYFKYLDKIKLILYLFLFHLFILQPRQIDAILAAALVTNPPAILFGCVIFVLIVFLRFKLDPGIASGQGTKGTLIDKIIFK